MRIVIYLLLAVSLPSALAEPYQKTWPKAPHLVTSMGEAIEKSDMPQPRHFRRVTDLVLNSIGSRPEAQLHAEADALPCSSASKPQMYEPVPDQDCRLWVFYYFLPYERIGKAYEVFIEGSAYQQKSTGKILNIDPVTSGVRCASCDN